MLPLWKWQTTLYLIETSPRFLDPMGNPFSKVETIPRVTFPNTRLPTKKANEFLEIIPYPMMEKTDNQFQSSYTSDLGFNRFPTT